MRQRALLCWRQAIVWGCLFNHISAGKVNTDPTPLEVEMRLYEENISKTLIDNAQRKEKKIDIS